MEVRIAFDPRLALSGEEFAGQWRESAENLAIGQLNPAPAARSTFGEPASFVMVLTGILLGVPSNAIWDAIKSTYQRLCAAKNAPAQPIEIQHIKYPDGTEITIVRLKD